MIEYDPQPPFDAGAVDKVDDVVMTRAVEYAAERSSGPGPPFGSPAASRAHTRRSPGTWGLLHAQQSVELPSG